MEADDTRRRLAWHGVLLVLLALVGGMFISAMANPRMALSAHVGTLLNGVLLIAIGAVWQNVSLGRSGQVGTFWLLLFGSYGTCLGLYLAATLATRESTPLHGAAVPADAWKESLVTIVLSVPGLAIVVGTALVLYGLRRRTPPV